VSPFELGLALLSGKAGKPWNARAIRARALIAGALGGAAPTAASEPPSPRPAPENKLHMKTAPAERAQAVEGARNIVDALARRRFDRLSELLGPEIWALWPNGAIARHPKAALVAEIEQRPGDRLPIKTADPKSYSYAELRSALARGVAEAHDAILELEDSTIVTLHISGGRGPAGRVMFAMTSVDGRWVAKSLAFGAPDDAHVVSGKLKERDANDGAVLGPVIRAVVLGHGSLVRASLQHLMPKLWVRDGLMEAEALAALADDGPARVGSSEVVFGRLREVDLKTIAKIAPKPGLAHIQAKAFEVFGEGFDAIGARLWSMDLGILDPATLKIQAAPPAHGLMIRLEDGAGRPRPRIAGLYV